MKTPLRVAVLMAGASLFTVGLGGCSNPQDAERALTGAGYSNIQTHGFDLFACSDSDFYSTKFTATNPAGKPVSGVVCSGLLFKNATIRF